MSLRFFVTLGKLLIVNGKQNYLNSLNPTQIPGNTDQQQRSHHWYYSKLASFSGSEEMCGLATVDHGPKKITNSYN